MGWTFLEEAAEESLTAGEWEQVYLFVNQAGLPHAERFIDPAHCPTCRNAIAAVLVARETDQESAIEAVTSMPAVALIDAFEG